MVNLANLRWEELMDLLGKEMNVLLSIEKVEQKKEQKENEIGSLNYQRNSILNYNTKVKIWIIILVHYLLTYGVPTYLILGAKEWLGLNIKELIIAGLIIYVVGFSVSTFIICMQKRKLVRRKKEAEKRLPDIGRQIAVAQNELNGIQRELEGIYRNNNSLLRMLPSAYCNRSILTEIYDILQTQRAYTWKDAVRIYEMGLHNREMLAQQKRHYECELALQQKMLEEQKRRREEELRYNEKMLEIERRRTDQAAHDAADIRQAIEQLGRY